MRLGLKLWSINTDNINEVEKLYNEGIYQYIELYVVPGTKDSTLDAWSAVNIPFVIHSPHEKHRFNLSKKELLNSNLKSLNEARVFADVLGADIIVMHPGIDGEVEEVIRQLKCVEDKRLVIENMPYYSIPDLGTLCVGNCHEEIDHIIRETEVGFCLDIAHAFCSALTKGEDLWLVLDKFLTLNPRLVHLSDNRYDSKIDRHLNLGAGDFDISRVLKYIGNDLPLTIETQRKQAGLKDFVHDVNVIRSLNRESIISNQ